MKRARCKSYGEILILNYSNVQKSGNFLSRVILSEFHCIYSSPLPFLKRNITNICASEET
jgi:hypothetical protein